MRPYDEIPTLINIYLEDSWVLGITAAIGSVSFDLDVVLTEKHRDYRTPTPGSQYCYRRGRLTFSGVTRLVWSNSGCPPAVDATDEEDFDNIDSFEWDETGCKLEGSWGSMEILYASVEVVFEDDQENALPMAWQGPQ